MKKISRKRAITAVVAFSGTIIGLLGYRSFESSQLAQSEAYPETVPFNEIIETVECKAAEERGQDANDTMNLAVGGCIAFGSSPKVVTEFDQKLLETGMADLDQSMLEASRRQIWGREDAMTDGWPAYEEVKMKYKEQAQQMISGKANDELVEIIKALREKFWSRGGTLSSAGYSDGYLARAIIEEAYERYPDDLAIGDELVETILAVCPIIRRQQESGEFRWSNEIEKVKNVRQRQFRQMMAEVEAGRRPQISDMVCVMDVMYLAQFDNKQLALQAVQWAQDNSTHGGWENYRYILSRAKEVIEDDGRIVFNIYQADFKYVEQEFKFGRRLPSFKGPESRNARLWGLMDGVITYRESSKS